MLPQTILNLPETAPRTAAAFLAELVGTLGRLHRGLAGGGLLLLLCGVIIALAVRQRE